MTARRYLAPEVVQTSAMDCGPASLTCLLEGFGTRISYGRLREACQTDVDGTSIDTLEEVANRLGLDAAQIMVPADHLLLPEAQALPALVVVRQPGGLTHFVVVWRRHGPFVQIMDPAQGRRWMRTDRLLRDLYVHTLPVPADAWRAWAGSDSFVDPLVARLRRLGLHRDRIAPLIDAAQQDAGWHAFAALDAATRMTEALLQAGGLRRGQEAERLLRATFADVKSAKRAAAADDPATVPESYWSARPADPDADGTARVLMRGAVLVQVRGRQAAGEAPPVAEVLSPELQAALDEAPARPGRTLWRLMRADGLLTPAALATALLVAAAGVLVEALLFRGLFELGHTLGLVRQRLMAMGLLVAFLGALLCIEGSAFAGLLRVGRRLEVRLRVAFLQKIPRLSDRYFQSRPVSDMAERGHALYRLRHLPMLAGGVLRAGFGLVLTTAGLIWLDPSTAPLALAAAGFALAWPLLTRPVLSERDLRVQTHTGALGRFYLDALLGLVAVRTHAAERSVRREHEGLLVEWARAGLRLQKTLVGLEGVQQFVGFGLAAWLLLRHLDRGEVGTVLLLVYWALNLPVLGQELALYVRRYPALRNTTLRLLEPLGAIEEAPETGEALPDGGRAPGIVPAARQRGVSLALEGVQVLAGGHTLLDGIDLQIPAGQHVAVVGRSGAGKSSLAGLFLGWHRAAAGRVSVDGAPLDRARLDALRRETAWVDPAVQLWNTSLLDNLVYAIGDGSTGDGAAGDGAAGDGAAGDGAAALGETLAQAELRSVLHTLPEGLQTRLGEGGARLSGGEGQRVRFGRALMQAGARLAILDEPFRGLDHERRRALLAAARRHWKDATLLCITHDLDATRDFERVLVVENGRIVEDGSPAGLLRQPSRYRALIEEDERVRARMEGADGWRRLHLAGGVLTEHPAAARSRNTFHPPESHQTDEAPHSVHLAGVATR